MQAATSNQGSRVVSFQSTNKVGRYTLLPAMPAMAIQNEMARIDCTYYSHVSNKGKVFSR